MENEIKKVAEEIESGNMLIGEGNTVLTNCAISIAGIALSSFKDELLSKALNISKAIVEYESELLSPR